MSPEKLKELRNKINSKDYLDFAINNLANAMSEDLVMDPEFTEYSGEKHTNDVRKLLNIDNL